MICRKRKKWKADVDWWTCHQTGKSYSDFFKRSERKIRGIKSFQINDILFFLQKLGDLEEWENWLKVLNCNGQIMLIYLS